jgi:Transposase
VCTSAWTCIASAPRSPSSTPLAPSSATATFPTIRPSWCRSWAPSRPGPRWLSRPPTAGAGWSSCSRSWSWNRTWSIPAAARRSPRPGCRNDKVDAATLAQLLRADLLPQAWIAPQATRDLRALLGHRASLVRMGTACKNRVHAILADRGIPDHSSLWTGPGRAWLADLELPATHGRSSRTAVGCWTPWPPRSPAWNAGSPPWPSPIHGSRRSWPSQESASSPR